MRSQPIGRDARYIELVAHYVDSLPAKLAALEHALAEARDGTSEALGTAREIAHRMRGTAGCYGLREMSGAAAVVDDELCRMLRGEGSAWVEVERATLLLRALAEAAVRRE